MGLLAPVATLAVLLGTHFSADTQSDRCADLKRPATFDKASAMEAVFCHYNRDHEGVLLPFEHHDGWDVEAAETLVSPLLAVTYREGQADKGVLVVQRQMIVDGEVVIAHAQTAVVSIYVLRRSDGRWQLERSEEEALDDGHSGHAPAPQLVKLGPDRHGVWFGSGDVHQGYSSESAIIVTLGEPTIREVGRFNLGESNAGTCSTDRREWVNGIHACWNYSGNAEFIASGGADYYTLRITYTGTEAVAPLSNRIRKKQEAVCLVKSASDYEEIADSRCAGYTPLADREVFLGDGTPRKTPVR
jgi:hypothetical protein